MRKKSNGILMLVLLMLVTSFFTGCGKSDTDVISTKKIKGTTGDMIAVVNQDAGIAYADRIVNYSEEFIKTLDEEDFDVVSSQTAEEGLKNGIYAAILTFPGNLSARILNINYKNPQAVNIEYTISGSAEKSSYDAVYSQITDAYQTFNNKLSYAYMNALVEEVELGQYNVEAIFSNNNSSIAAARILANGNIFKVVEAMEMPETDVSFDNADASGYKAAGDTFIKAVDAIYERAYSAAYDNAINSKETDTDTYIKYIQDNVKSITDIVSEIGDYKGAVDDFMASDGDLGKYIASVNNYKSKVIDGEDSYKACVDAYRKSVEDYDKAIEEYINNNDDEKKENLRSAVKSAKKAMAEKAENLEKWDSNMPSVEEEPVFEASDELPGKDEFNQIKKNLEEYVKSLNENLKKQREALNPENITDNALSRDTGKTYREQLDTEKNKLRNEADTITENVNNAQLENISKLDKAYTEYSGFLSENIKSVNTGYLQSKEQLERSMSEFLKTAEANNSDTKKRLAGFQGMLSSAKVNGRVSSEVMSFLIQPIQLIENNKNN